MPTSHPLNGAPDPESPRTCPYNSSHVLSIKRLQFHLVKCRKSYPNAKKETCPFNTTHLINEQEFKFHLEICPDRGVIDSYTYITPNAETCKIEAVPAPVLPPNEENWDDEYSGTYEPATGTAESTVTHTFIGGTKSERKKFRHQQRQRFRALSESAPDEAKAVPQEIDPSDDQPLRRPTTRSKCVMNDSAQLGPQNQSFVARVSCASGSTQQPQKPSGVAVPSNNRKPRLTAAERLIKTRPGRSQDDDDDDDGFVVFRSKGRGQFRE